jgi:dihydrofolate synthase/folylpolyglutamate synthase
MLFRRADYPPPGCPKTRQKFPHRLHFAISPHFSLLPYPVDPSMPSSPNLDDKLARKEEAARKFLFARIDYERARNVPYRAREFKLARMRELLDRIGNPHRPLPTLHVAGTKGKGSTAAMIGAVLTAAGFRTGVFSSPHLDRLEERLAIDGRPCSAAELVELIERLIPPVTAMDQAAAGDPLDDGPTYFEIVTAMALLHFARRRVQSAVLEVGLGGRLDSTNVCRPLVSAITSISLDHTKQLGNTLEAIAREKAGIIKPHVPVVSGVTDAGPRQVIRQICGQKGCRLVELGVDFDFAYHPPRKLETAPALGKVDFRWSSREGDYHLRGVPLALLGRHQAANAAVALAVLAELRRIGWTIPDEAVRVGLAELRWPARVELVARQPALVVDSAHNPASVDALIETLDESFSARRRLLVFATTYDKDVRGMLQRLVPAFDHLILTRYLSNPRAVPPEELAAVAAKISQRPSRVCRDPAEAWQLVCALAEPDDLICVTGSFFLAAEIRQLIRAASTSQS